MGAMSLFHWLIVTALIVGLLLWYKGRKSEIAVQRRQRRRMELEFQQCARELERAGPLPKTTRGSRAPAWFLPAGIACLVIGLLAFVASAAVSREGDAAGRILVGITNPLFFVGVPLGIYWLVRSGKGGSRGSFISTQEDVNPRLTHCPDCGRQVSRLATTCPHCGRPLSPES